MKTSGVVVSLVAVCVCLSLASAQEAGHRVSARGTGTEGEASPDPLSSLTAPRTPLSNSCRGTIDLSYPQAPPSNHVGDTVRVAIGLGAGTIVGGTSLNINRVRFGLDCNGAHMGIACQDDGPVVSYQGGLTSTCGMPFVADHAPGDTLPNQVVFTPISAFSLPGGIRNSCRLEFNVRIESPSNDATPDTIEQVAGFDGANGDCICNTSQPLAAGVRDTGQICMGTDCQTLATSCEPMLDLSYPGSPNLLQVGATARAHIVFGGGHTGQGVPIVVHRLRYDLDCAGTTVGANCLDDGTVVSYRGNLSTTCPVAFTCDHADGDVLPNQVVFTPNGPFSIPPDTPGFCSLDFDIRVEGRSNDLTPDTIEQAIGVDDGAEDVVCDVAGRSRAAVETSSGSLQVCPVCDDGNACNGIETCDGATGCVPGTPPVCDDGNTCTDDSCDPAIGCVFTPNGTCGEGSKGVGYWKRLCQGTHASGDYFTPFDVACVSRACPFADVQTIEDLCDRLTPDPSNDACAKAETELLSLELNVCRSRVSDSDPVPPSCGSATTVGQARAHIEELLCDPGRTQAQCRHASCSVEGSGRNAGAKSRRR